MRKTILRMEKEVCGLRMGKLERLLEGRRRRMQVVQ